MVQLLVYAGLRADEGDLALATRLFGASAAWGIDRGWGEAAFAAAWAAGQALALDEAVAEALAGEPDAG